MPTIPTANATPVVAVATASATTIPVEVPEDCGPGSLIRVPLDNGELFDVTVPEGCYKGSVFQVAMPSQKQSSTKMPTHKGPVVQNKHSHNSIGDILDGDGVHIKLDKTPIVKAGTENRTIAIQMSDRGCCKEGFYGNYQPGKVNMKSDEFYKAIEKYEKVGCCGCKDRVTDDLNKEFNGRNIHFKIERRANLVLDMDVGAYTDEDLFLTITQN